MFAESRGGYVGTRDRRQQRRGKERLPPAHRPARDPRKEQAGARGFARRKRLWGGSRGQEGGRGWLAAEAWGGGGWRAGGGWPTANTHTEPARPAWELTAGWTAGSGGGHMGPLTFSPPGTDQGTRSGRGSDPSKGQAGWSGSPGAAAREPAARHQEGPPGQDKD